jgi:hypothetical protein
VKARSRPPKNTLPRIPSILNSKANFAGGHFQQPIFGYNLILSSIFNLGNDTAYGNGLDFTPIYP